MPKFADLIGVLGSTFTIGSRALGEGVRRLAFRSGSFLGALDWNVTANRTINLPNASGTVLLDTTATIAGSLVNPVGVSVVDFTIPAGVRRLTLLSNGLVSAGAIVRLGTSSGVLVAEYNSVIHYYGQFTGVEASSTAGICVPKCGNASVASFCMTFHRVSPNGWNSTGQGRDGLEYGSLSIGTILLPGELTTFRYISQSVMNSGSLQLLWEF